MSEQSILFLLRLAGAVLLLSFLGLLFWYLLQDLRAARATNGEQAGFLGLLRVLDNTSAAPPVDALYELAPITTIGRNNRNTIVLDDTYVSGEHALLSWRDSQWWLEDMGSRNGTYLNDIAIMDPIVLSAGDVITIGGVRFKLDLAVGKAREELESGIRDSNP